MSLTNDDKKWIQDAIVSGVVDALNEIVIPRFDEHDRRFDEHDKRFDEHDKRFDAIEKDVAELKNDMREVKSTLRSMDDRLDLLETDVKEIYYMIAELQKQQAMTKAFAKLPLEKKILRAYADIVAMAKEAGVSLPR